MDIADLSPDPITQFSSWFAEVVEAGVTEPTAMALATADAEGRPVARHVLLKGHDVNGFVFFTNYESRKGRHLAANSRASLAFPWFPIRRQVIVTGTVERIDPTESNAYFATRDRQSQIAAWASEQSEEIPDRAWLEARVEHFEAEFEGRDVARPPHWGGYRLRPDAIEFWAGRPNRLHDRFRYDRLPDGTWRIARLAP